MEQPATPLIQVGQLLSLEPERVSVPPQQPSVDSVSIGMSLPKSPLLSAAKEVTAGSPPPQQPFASGFAANPSNVNKNPNVPKNISATMNCPIMLRFL